MDIKKPLQEASYALKLYAGRLSKLNILTLEDLLYHIPSRYENFSLVAKIGTLQPGEVVTVQGQILEMKNIYTRNFKKIQQAVIADETGSIELVWFNQPYLTKYIKPKDTLSVSGKVDYFQNKLVLTAPEYEVVNAPTSPILHTGRLVPIYPETKGVTSKWLRRQIYNLLKEHAGTISDYLPTALKRQVNNLSLKDALWQIHFPDTLKQAAKAKERLAFDELFLLQLTNLKRRTEWERTLTSSAFKVRPFQDKIQAFWESLPFALTGAQIKALDDIFKDLSSEKPMNRLLQGDVGSGKTVVAAIAMYVAYLNGFQSVLMAPTEILAQQHFSTVSKLLSPLGVTVDLVTSSIKTGFKNNDVRLMNKKNHKSSIINHKSQLDILIGTHAVLSEKVTFDRLGLIVIDEQQRFGVEQRSTIRQKGNNPHVLSMTATPIPRTVALTLYGDLDLSYLDEMPKGRKIVKTWLVPEEKREGAYGWIRKEIQTNKSQAFIICPFIEESESMQTVKAATKEFERLKNDVFPDLSLTLLHGKKKAKEKDTILKDFKDKKFDILVSTPVVEVGIDIPNATIILIEASERFGLAQLHQLRGRVGRGDRQSYCLLFTESKSPITLQRLKAMESKHVGAELAELDLRLRGPGELYGTRQSGLPNLKIASFSDFPLIEKARIAAEKLLPEIEKHPQLAAKIKEQMKSAVSPD